MKVRVKPNSKKKAYAVKAMRPKKSTDVARNEIRDSWQVIGYKRCVRLLNPKPVLLKDEAYLEGKWDESGSLEVSPSMEVFKFHKREILHAHHFAPFEYGWNEAILTDEGIFVR